MSAAQNCTSRRPANSRLATVRILDHNLAAALLRLNNLCIKSYKAGDQHFGHSWRCLTDVLFVTTTQPCCSCAVLRRQAVACLTAGTDRLEYKNCFSFVHHTCESGLAELAHKLQVVLHSDSPCTLAAKHWGHVCKLGQIVLLLFKQH